ncbi:unnamed protein product [Pedinophyceae sp. YPF-701]|nr:unnamed protein product [Pedinophyceae sp. YPF-701]
MSFLSGLMGSRDGSGDAVQAGGNSRDDGKVSFGWGLMRGKRTTMEDFHYAGFVREAHSGEQVGCFGVYDGHGGSAAAEFVKEHLFRNLLKSPKFQTDVPGAIVDSFLKTDKEYLEQNGEERDDGCTAVIAVVKGSTLYVAHVGDSRAVLSREGEAVALSDDHKPNRSDERSRIEGLGGVVVWAGTWRVGGVLAVSRAFGDKMLKKFVVAEPEVATEELSKKDECLVLASDGLWDVMTNEEAVETVRKVGDAKEAAKTLVDEAYKRGSGDNISAIAVVFKFE